MDAKFTELVEQLNGLDFKGMYGSDFLHTWDKTTDELKALYIVADALRELRENNVSSKIFDSGLAVSLFRDNSTRTRFSFSKAANLLGLELQDLDEKKSQIAHGETVRETATMISFMADVIGIRDDMYIGKGDAYMAEVSESVQQAYEDGVLDHRPTLISLQSDSDHPTQSSADMLYLINEFGGLENLKGKKVAVTWAYSPSYGKPLSCPQSLISLLPRFGMDVTLAHPEGYDLMPEVVERAKGYAAESGTTFKQVNTMAEAFEGADIVIPKSWARLPPWRSVPICTPRATTPASLRSRRSCSPRTPPIRIGAPRPSSWRRLPTARTPSLCTRCPPTSPVSPASTARLTPTSSTCTAWACTRRPATSRTPSLP